MLKCNAYLASLFICLFVKVQTKATNGWQIVKLKMFSPEDRVGAGFAGGARVQHVVQTKLAVVAFLSWKISSLNYPQLEHILHPPAVVLKRVL